MTLFALSVLLLLFISAMEQKMEGKMPRKDVASTPYATNLQGTQSFGSRTPESRPPQQNHRVKRADEINVEKTHKCVSNANLMPFSAIGRVYILLRTVDRLTADDILQIEQDGGTWKGVKGIHEFVLDDDGTDRPEKYRGLTQGTCSGFIFEHCRIVATAAHCMENSEHTTPGHRMQVVAMYYVPAPSVPRINADVRYNILHLYRQSLTMSSRDNRERMRADADKNIFWVELDKKTGFPKHHISNLYMEHVYASVPERADSAEYEGFRQSMASVDFALLTLAYAPKNTGFLVSSKSRGKRNFDGAMHAYAAGFPAIRRCSRTNETVLVRDDAVLKLKEVAISLPAIGQQTFPFNQRMLFGPCCLESGISGGPILRGRLPDESECVTWKQHFEKDASERGVANYFVQSLVSTWTGPQGYASGADLLSPLLQRPLAILKADLGDDYTCAPGFDPEVDLTDTDDTGNAWQPSFKNRPRFSGQKTFQPSRKQAFPPGDQRTTDPYYGETQVGSLPLRDDEPLHDFCGEGVDESCIFAEDEEEEDEALSDDNVEETPNLVFEEPPQQFEKDSICHNKNAYDSEVAKECCIKDIEEPELELDPDVEQNDDADN